MGRLISIVDADEQLCRFSLYDRHREHLKRIRAWHETCIKEIVSTVVVDTRPNVNKQRSSR